MHARHLLTAAALTCALCLAPEPARAHHCGGTDTDDFSYMGTTCRYQRATGAWQYNHDMTVTDEYDPYIIVQRTTDANNCGSATSMQVMTDGTAPDSDTASYTVAVALGQAEKAAIAADMAATLQIMVEAGFSAGTQTTSTVSGTAGSTVTTEVPGCSRTRIEVALIGLHNAAVSASVSQHHWFRIHCDDPQYTTSWNICATSTQGVSGTSATACLSRAYTQTTTTDLGCAPEELASECTMPEEPCLGPCTTEPDAGVPDAGPGPVDAGPGPVDAGPGPADAGPGVPRRGRI